ncbi:MAG: hypothetical protein V4578_16725 [Pseudomonadota bacterium]
MINVAKIGLLLTPFLFSVAESAPQDSAQSNARALDRVLHERDESGYTYPTKFGDLKFITENGTIGEPAEKIVLNGKDFLSVKDKNDEQGVPLSLMSESLMIGSAIETIARKPGQGGRVMTKRIVILEGSDGNCIKHLLILDFTGQQPFISERFGYNPQDKYCITFKKAKWGAKESYIYLEGPMKYIYYTGGRVFGPI